MASALYLLILITLFAGIERISTPARERNDLRTWTPRDVWCNARRGVIVLGEHGLSYPPPYSPAPRQERQTQTPKDHFHERSPNHLHRPLVALAVVFWIPLRELTGRGTFLNVALVGAAADVTAHLIPPQPRWSNNGPNAAAGRSCSPSATRATQGPASAPGHGTG